MLCWQIALKTLIGNVIAGTVTDTTCSSVSSSADAGEKSIVSSITGS